MKGTSRNTIRILLVFLAAILVISLFIWALSTLFGPVNEFIGGMS